jgi:uncharacterized protein
LSEKGRPVPVPDDRSRDFWDAASTHTLVLARCGKCARFCHPPDALCPHCGTSDPAFSFIPVDGSGSVRSWTIIRQSFLPGFDVPFVLVDVELAVQEDLRLIGRLVDGPLAPVRLGASVRSVFEDVAPGVAVPAFALDSGS